MLSKLCSGLSSQCRYAKLTRSGIAKQTALVERKEEVLMRPVSLALWPMHDAQQLVTP